MTKATGLDKVAKAVLGDDCGCNQRKEWLNARFPYSRKYTTMTEHDMKIMDKHIVPAYEQDVLYQEGMAMTKELYARYIGKPRKWSTGCGSCFKTAIEELLEVYNASCPEK